MYNLFSLNFIGYAYLLITVDHNTVGMRFNNNTSSLLILNETIIDYNNM